MQGSLMLDIGGTWLTAEDRQILRHPEVGGLIIFARNIEHPAQVRELCAAIRAIRPDLLLAVDQEGGRVQRLRQGFVRLPAMRAIADNPNAEELAEHCGWLMATEVQAVGLDLSFAPVLDLDHQRSAVVGSRAFEGDPERAALLAGAFIRGMHAAGMAATGKHFPGHGWAEADSHVAIPEDARSLEEIRRSDLVPFARLAGQLDALMPAHVIYPQVDPQPAGFSRRWLQEIQPHRGRPGRGLRHGSGVQRPGFRRAGPGCPATPEGDPAVASATHARQGLREYRLSPAAALAGSTVRVARRATD